MLLVAVLLLPRVAAAEPDPDPWFGKDKALHFGVSAGLASGGYGLASVAYDDRLPRFLWGGGAALAIGATKEGADSLGYGQASWRDFTWDVIGVAVGLGIAWLIDVSIEKDRPVKVAPRGH